MVDGVEKLRIGLVLSGGGARGIAHLGVLRALHEAGIYPEEVAGTSAGAIAGALYCSGLSPDRMLDFVRDATVLKFLKVTVPYAGLTKLTYLQSRLAAFIDEDSFEGLQRKLHVVVTNLNKGRWEVFDSGPLFRAVLASSAIPLIFKPIEIEGELFVDGGLLNNLPVHPLVKRELDLIIGVNVMPLVEAPPRSVQSALGIATRCFDLSIQANARHSRELCDLLIEPRRLNAYHIFHLNKYEDLEEIGYRAAQESMDQLEALLEEALARRARYSVEPKADRP